MKTFSAYWSDSLGEAIKEACKEEYPIECHPACDDFQSLQRAVNQGIDSLEAVSFREDIGEHGRIRFSFKPESVPVLVRRLLESGEENDSDISLASSICETLDIELI